MELLVEFIFFGPSTTSSSMKGRADNLSPEGDVWIYFGIWCCSYIYSEITLLWHSMCNTKYRQVSNIRRTLVGN